MADQVRVEDLAVFALFRAALVKFAQAASQSLSNADSQVSRTHSWLEGEQMTRWQGQLRKRSEAVVKARDAVRQKKLYKDASGQIKSAVEEEKELAKALAAVEHAREKLESVRKWLPRLEKAADNYRSGVSRLSRNVEGDIPKGVALLDRLAASLEEYVQVESSAGMMSDAGAAVVPGESMSRGGQAAEDAPPKPEPAAPGPAEEKHVAE